MPNYGEITDAVLKMWEDYLDILSLGLYKSVNVSTVRYFIMEVYEFIAVNVAYMHSKDKKNEYKATWKIINETLGKDEPWVLAVKELMNHANAFRHEGAYPIKGTNNFSEVICLNKLISIPEFMIVWDRFFKGSSKTYELLHDFARLEVIILELTKDKKFLNQCMNYANYCLGVDIQTGESLKSVGETISSLCERYKCSENYAVDVVRYIIDSNKKV